jgi:hypothetical protein
MFQPELIRAALQQTIEEIPESPTRRRLSGKVRDVFEMPGDRLAIAVTDRISVFDVVLDDPVQAMDPSKIDGLVRAIRVVLEDPSRAASMGVAGRERIAQLFDVKSWVDETEALFTRITEGK